MAQNSIQHANRDDVRVGLLYVPGLESLDGADTDPSAIGSLLSGAVRLGAKSHLGRSDFSPVT